MTESSVRRDLKSYRLSKRWSFDQLYADMRQVLGRDTVSPRTLVRFERGDHKSHQYTVADIADYLKVAKKRVAA